MSEEDADRAEAIRVELEELQEVIPDLEDAATSKSIEEAVSSILERWNITVDELTQLVDSNGSLRGMLLGYVAELEFTQI